MLRIQVDRIFGRDKRGRAAQGSSDDDDENDEDEDDETAGRRG